MRFQVPGLFLSKNPEPIETFCEKIIKERGNTPSLEQIRYKSILKWVPVPWEPNFKERERRQP
jgi:hypothetical protein